MHPCSWRSSARVGLVGEDAAGKGEGEAGMAAHRVCQVAACQAFVLSAPEPPPPPPPPPPPHSLLGAGDSGSVRAARLRVVQPNALDKDGIRAACFRRRRYSRAPQPFENPQVCQAKPAHHVLVVLLMLLLVVGKPVSVCGA